MRAKFALPLAAAAVVLLPVACGPAIPLPKPKPGPTTTKPGPDEPPTDEARPHRDEARPHRDEARPHRDVPPDADCHGDTDPDDRADAPARDR